MIDRMKNKELIQMKRLGRNSLEQRIVDFIIEGVFAHYSDEA